MAKIMVAEDDRHIARVIVLWLQRAGHVVVTATDGRSALELLRHEQPDLLVTDVNMPGMDGLDLLEAASSEGLLKHPAIVLTSRCDAVDIGARAGRLGAVVHPKPFSPLHLKAAIEAALVVSQVDLPAGGKVGAPELAGAGLISGVRGSHG